MSNVVPKPRPKLSQTKWFLSVVPWSTSLLIHSGVVLFAILTYTVVQKVNEVAKPQLIIPDSNLIDDAPLGGVINPGGLGDPNEAAGGPTPSEVLSRLQTPAEIGQSIAPTVTAPQQMIGVGPAPAIGQQGGSLSPFPTPAGGGAAPRSSFAGTSGNARNIVYLCDASGTMMSVFGDLRAELSRSISNLRPIQAFNIVLFKDEQVLMLSKTGLIPAGPQQKKQADAFVNSASANGQTSPIPAIRAAFAQQPELIYVLTDGFDNVSNFDEVIREFKRLNPQRAVKVNTILIRSSNDQQLVDVLRQIADDSGGVFRAIDRTQIRQ